jgi:hypothetical protein
MNCSDRTRADDRLQVALGQSARGPNGFLTEPEVGLFNRSNRSKKSPNRAPPTEASGGSTANSYHSIWSNSTIPPSIRCTRMVHVHGHHTIVQALYLLIRVADVNAAMKTDSIRQFSAQVRFESPHHLGWGVVKDRHKLDLLAQSGDILEKRIPI